MSDAYCFGCGQPIHDCECDPPIKACWYKRDSEAKWEEGFFHQWSQNYEEFESGPGPFPAAIVEGALSGECHVVYAGHVSFSRVNPDPPAEDLIEKMFADGYQLPSQRGLTGESSDIEVEAAYQAMVQQEGGDHSQGGECYPPPYDHTPPRFIPLPSGRKFEPRLVWVTLFRRWLIQVHPETIEVFNDNEEYLCQVRWIDGKMNYFQGGLPLEALEEMFRESQ